MRKRYLECGKIVSVHGLRGDVKIQPWGNEAEELCRFGVLFLKNGETAMQVEKARVLNHMGLVKFAGVDTPEAAQKLRGQIVYMDRELDTLEEGEYYVQDLIGLEVVHAETGESYGTVTDYLENGANGIYVLKYRDGSEKMIPAIKEVVKKVDLDANRLEIIPLEGLFEDAAEV